MQAVVRRPLSRLLVTLLLLTGSAATAGSRQESPFERPPGLADADWAALSAELSKTITSEQTLRPQDQGSFGQGDGTSFMQFGRALAVSGTTLVVGAPEAVSCVLTTSSCGGSVGAAYVYERVAGAWQFRQKLIAADQTIQGSTNRNFGASVAIDGDTLLVGAGRARDASSPNNFIGGVYVFTRSAGSWTQAQKLLPPTPVPGTDEFGAAVALIGDTAVVGNPGRTVAGAARAGAVHVFTRSGGTFSQAALLTASDGAVGNRLGDSVAYSGTTILAGAPLGDAPSPADSGAAYVFTGSAASWTEQAKLVANDPLVNARFGLSVDLDGDSAAIGAPGWTTNQGRAYVFARAGTTWSQQQRLDAGAANANQMGSSVAIRGNQIAVGAPDTAEPLSTQGVVRLFSRSGTTWTLEQSILGPLSLARIGVAVRLFDDGGTPGLLAATGTDLVTGSSGIETLRTYRRSGSAPTPFELAGDLTRPRSTQQAFFGTTVAVDGDLAVVGMPFARNAIGNSAGAAYVYARSGSQWTLRGTVTGSSAPFTTANLGTAVAISGTTIAVGAPREDLPGAGSGCAYVYTVGATTIDLQQRICIDNVSNSNQAFGRSLSIDGDTLAVGAPFTSNPGQPANFGRVFVYTRSGGVWTKQQEIVDANPPGSNGEFGNYVVLRGDGLVVGVRPFQTSGFVPYVAAATRSGNTWTIVQRITEPPGSAVASGGFGLSLAWSGTTLAIGADPLGGSNDPGRVYLYDGAPGSFALAQTLRQTDGTATTVTNRFGAALALSGARLLVGAPGTGLAGAPASGAVYAYERIGASWQLAARLRPSSPDDTTNFFGGPASSPTGGSVLAYAGDQVLIGIPNSNGQVPFAAQNVGAVAVFGVPRRTTLVLGASPNVAALDEPVSARWTLSAAAGTPGGNVTVVASSGETCSAAASVGACTLTFARAGLRSLVATYAGAPGFGQSRSAPTSVQVGDAGGLVGEDPVIPPDFGTGGNEQIGFAVAMTDTLLVAGAPGAGPGTSEGRGAVYVFERSATAAGAAAGLLAQKSLRRIAVLTDAAGANGHRFGHAVAISADGTRIAVGAPAAGAGLGRAVVFVRSGAAWVDSSSPNIVLVPSPAAGETVQRFGESIDLDASGNVVVGAPRSDRAGAADAGAAYLFDAAGVQRAALAATTPAANDLLGSAVAIDAGLVTVGAPGLGATAGSNRGGVATWTFDGTLATAGPVLVASDAANNQRFGAALALSGNLLAIGAPGRSAPRGGGYVFLRAAGALTEVARLAPAADAGVSQAGVSVAVNATTVLLGAPDSSAANAAGTQVSGAGEVAVFRRFDGNWSGDLAQDAVLALAGANFNDNFGRSVAASAEGVAVGAPLVDVAPIDGPVQSDYGIVVPYLNVGLFANGFEPPPAP